MEKIKNINKNYLISSGVIVLILLVLVVPQKAQAGMETMVIQLLSWVANAINYVVGELLLIAITILIRVANFGDFINANIVQIGWVIMRDIANMIIVIALMIIAFGTTINKQTYHYQKLLPGLVIAAVLVNFSKVITGLMIDLSQVVMMPFVHAFHDIAAGNIIYGLGIEDMVNARNILESKMGVDVNDWTVFGALVMGVIMMLVALFVVVSLAWMLLLRIIRLWILVIFSPVAFVGNLLPVGKNYVNEWWGELNKQLVFGPTLAFMFWLSMSVLSQVTEDNRLINLSMQSQVSAGTATAETYNYFASQISSPQRVFDYLVTLALLLFCLMTAKKAGVMGADLAGKFMGKLENAGKWVTKRPSVWGKKGWERAKVSHVGEGVRALVQRGKTSGLGRALGGDKEYSKEQADLRRARMTELLGGKRGAGAMREFQYKQAMKTQKEMQEKGQLEGGEDALRQLFKNAVGAKKMDEARAIMLKMASSKDANLRTEDLETYREAIGVQKENSGSREEEDYKKFMEDLMSAQKSSGDSMAQFKFGVKRDSQGRLIYMDNIEDEVRKKFSETKEADFNNGGIIKAFDETKPEFLAILDELNKKKNMRALNQDGRDSYAKIVQRVLARAEAGELTLNEDQVANYRELFEKLTARSFNRDTGEARLMHKRDYKKKVDDLTGIIGLTTDYEKANDSDKQAMEGADTEFVRLNSDGELKKISESSQRKRQEKQRDDLLYGRETPSEFDEDFEENVLRPTVGRGGSAIMPEVYTAVNDARSANFTDFHFRTQGNVKKLYNDLLTEAKARGSSEVVNPETGVNYTYEEIFANSELGKTLERLINLSKPTKYLTISPGDHEKYRQATEFLLDKVKFLIERADWNVGESGLAKRVSGRIKNRVVENRVLNRDELSGAKSVARDLQGANLTGQEREKKLNSLITKLEKALKHSQKHNQDQLFVGQLSDLVNKARSLDVGTKKEDLETFITQIDIVLNQVQAK
ncbi:MAG TPA: hypothetical protein PKZ16_01955 [bacterium]|nr:hypothetical protein [bacterium]